MNTQRKSINGLDTEPWYKQTWAWVLILLPAIAVTASLSLVYIAYTHQDPLVTDSYDRNGLATVKKADDKTYEHADN